MSANVSFLGNLGRSPETRRNDDGTLIANFSIASNTARNTPQGVVKKTDWFRVTAIGKQAETLAKHAKKGSKLLVQGKLTFNPWKDREGRAQVSADLLLQDFQFVGDGSNKADQNVEDDAETAHYSVETEVVTNGVQEIVGQKRAF